MSRRALCVRCTTRYLSSTRGSTLGHPLRDIAVVTELDSSKRKVPSGVVWIAGFHSQPSRLKKAAAAAALQPKDAKTEITSWLEEKQLAHPRFTSHEDPTESVRIGMTWFSGGSDFNLQNFLAQLPKFATKESQSIKNVVVLATPSLGYLLERRDFLQEIIARIHAASDIAPSQAPDPTESGKEVKSIAAIVDALPYSATSTGRLRDAEGLSILFSSSSSYTEPAPPDLTGDESANYTLTFVSRTNIHDLSYQLGIGRRQLAVGYLTLPVANTFFVNGSRATLVEDTWKVTSHRGLTGSDRETDTLASDISHEHREGLQSATIDAAFHYDALGQCKLPLTPLTKPRAITKAMGNVVTEIKTGALLVPASSELEKSVSEYIGKNVGATSTGPLMIYASIMPQFGARFPESDSNFLLPLPTESLQLQSWSMMNNRKRNMRLFRVTGGGGGWGKKQGLLSLDPAVDFSGQSTVSSFPDIDDSGDIGQISEPKGMMPPLSTIQFWVFNNHSTPLAEDQQMDLDRILGRSGVEQEKNGKDQMCFVLGTGSRAEEREGIEGEERQALDRSEIQQQCVHGYFGMLTYGGTAVGSLQALRENAAGPLYTGARSRIDVPNTTFVLEFEAATKPVAVRAARPLEKTS